VPFCFAAGSDLFLPLFSSRVRVGGCAYQLVSWSADTSRFCWCCHQCPACKISFSSCSSPFVSQRSHRGLIWFWSSCTGVVWSPSPRQRFSICSPGCGSAPILVCHQSHFAQVLGSIRCSCPVSAAAPDFSHAQSFSVLLARAPVRICFSSCFVRLSVVSHGPDFNLCRVHS
jgi:hypothetical protein